MGGTGLSGLAFSEGADSFPAPWRDVFFIANPITGKIQAIRCHRSSQPDVSSSNAGGTAGSTPHLDPLPLKRVEEKRVARKVHSRNAPPKVATLSLPAEGRGRGDGWPAKGMVSYGNGWRLEHLPDFIQCADPWFRPVAMDFGPDGRLYIVDWYNKIISHNEVPRNHPERDKIRGRIWRVRHQSQSHRGTVPNLDRVSEKQLLAHLRAANTWEVNAAWEEVVDRQAVSLVPALARLVTDEAQPDDLRLRALWCLEGLGKVQPAHLKKLAGARHRALRMQALRVARDTVGQASRLPIPLRIGLAERGLADPDRLVRQEALRLLGALLEESRGTTTRARRLVGLLFEAASQPPESGGPKFQPYFAAFETYLVRRALERSPDAVATWLDARPAAPVELQALGCVTLGGSSGAKRLAALLPELARRLSAEELFLLASDPNEPAAKAALEAALADPGALRLFYDNRARLTDHASLGPLLADAVRALVKNDPTGDNQDLLVKLASAFKLESLENDLVGIVQRAAGILPADPPARPIAGPASPARSLAAVRALRELQSTRVDLFKALARSNRPDLQREGVLALAVARSDAAVPALLEVWPSLTTTLRKTAVDRLASSATNARALVSAISRDAISRDELDGYTLDKLATVLPDDADVQRLVSELGPTLQPVLRLNGGTDDRVDTNLTLDGPFTVECWVKLDPGIGNEDSILAGVGALDANFHESRFRVFVANGPGDIVIARRPMAPDSWTHVAFTRDAEGRFRVYINGELDNTGERTDRRQFERLQIGLSLAAGGTAGELAEFRVWSECRSSDEIRSAANLALAVNGPRASSPAAARPVREGMDPLAQHIAPQPGRRPATLLYLGTGESWGRLLGNARIERTAELPPLQTEADAAALAAKFDTFRKLANSDGDAARGREIFGTVCGVCHSVGGQGGRIGPVLDGAAANGVEALLRNVLTPNAAMEAGYRRFRVETGDGELQEGLLVLQDDAAIVLRQINGEDLGIPRARVKRAAYTKLSMMPEGLIEPLPPSQVSDLFAYLKTLK
jgi:putative heme-binding domain-containing protein